MGPGQLGDFLLLLEVQQPEQVGDPGIRRDVVLPADGTVRHLGLHRHDGQFVLVHGLHGQVQALHHFVFPHVEHQCGVIVHDRAGLELAFTILINKFNESRLNVKSRFKVQNLATKMEFRMKKSRFSIKSQIKESKCADGGHSLN